MKLSIILLALMLVGCGGIGEDLMNDFKSLHGCPQEANMSLTVFGFGNATMHAFDGKEVEGRCIFPSASFDVHSAFFDASYSVKGLEKELP